MIGCECSCSCIQRVEPFGGSVFPKLDEYLDTYDARFAVDFLEDKRASRHYANTQDYLLCLVFPEYERQCKAFYKERGKDLISTVSRERIREIETAIIARLEHVINHDQFE